MDKINLVGLLGVAKADARILVNDIANLQELVVAETLAEAEAEVLASTQSHQLDNTIRFEATTAGMEKITHHIKRLSQRVDELENRK